MLYLLLVLFATAASLTVLAIAELLSAQPRNLARQLAVVEQLSRGESGSMAHIRAPSTRARIAELLERLGHALQRDRASTQSIRELLVQAGYRRPEALSVFWGARVAGTVAVALTLAGVSWVTGRHAGVILVCVTWAVVMGWMVPKLYLRTRAQARRREIERNLPDALDLLIVCMEAGLGLNLAFARMAEEIRHFSAATSEEFQLVNLEIRAGVPREDALRSLGTRMGIPELRSLSTMLIQADRFGTSIAQALRVYSDTGRTKRRQRAEELAAKTTIKLIFPLVLCVFPTVFVVVLAPAAIEIIRKMGAM